MPNDTPTTPPRVLIQQDGPLARVVLSNPARLNALDFDMWDSLPGHLAALDAHPEVRIIVLQGDGERAFAAGSDISQFGERRNTPEGVALYNATVDRAMQAVAAVNKPTVAVVRGVCFGGGVALATHCDLRYATPDARFSIPAAKLGLGYNPMWVRHLALLIGPARTKEILYGAGQYDADAALRMGLVNAVQDDDATQALLQRLCTLAPLTQAASKLAVDQTCSPSGFDADRCWAAVDRCFASADYAEGRQAFTEKRAPRFSGR